MGQDISVIKQQNLWGKSADKGGGGLEPQRNDLYYVDFSNAVRGVQAGVVIQLAEIVPQYVRSITFPELKLKSDPIRRDSIPYNTPSWDEPLDAIKITFFLDTHEKADDSYVIDFLDFWLVLTRAGRGSRKDGYSPKGWVTLDSKYRVDFQFDVGLYLLRGKVTEPIMTPEEVVRWNNFQWVGSAFSALDHHSTYTLKGAWLASYKLSDFSYVENGLSVVEASFYADSVDLTRTRDVPEGTAMNMDGGVGGGGPGSSTASNFSLSTL